MNAVVQAEGAPAPSETVPTQSPAEAGTPETTGAVKPPAAPQPGEVDTQGGEPRGVAKRLKELTEARRAAEAREERLLRLLEQQRTTPTEAPKVEQPKTLKDYNYDERAYQDHLYTEARKHAEAAAREAGVKWKAEQEAIARRAKFDERVSKFAETVQDYNEVVTDSTPVSEGMADAIMDSDEAGALMYYLGNNPDVASKLYHMSPAKAGREIQKLEDKLVAERKKAAEKPVSNAPPPAPHIDAGDPGTGNFKPDDPESDKLSDAEWTRRREKQLQSRRK